MRTNFDIGSWMRGYADAVRCAFGERVWFLGLQGSRARGEATDASDIDTVLILDVLSAQDLADYDALLGTLPERGRVCGFVSGRAEIEAWEKSELFQFCLDTVALIGSLEHLLQGIARDDVRRAVRSGAGAVYHGCVHNILHEKSADILKSLYKQAAFTLRAATYLQSDVFERKIECLPALLPPDDAAVAEEFLRLRGNGIADDDFARLSEALLAWASRWLQKDL